MKTNEPREMRLAEEERANEGEGTINQILLRLISE